MLKGGEDIRTSLGGIIEELWRTSYWHPLARLPETLVGKLSLFQGFGRKRFGFMDWCLGLFRK